MIPLNCGPDWLLFQGDARRIPLPDGSVHCCVCSPPYFGLRDYGTGRWEGGLPGCDHVEMAVGMSDRNTLGARPGRDRLPATNGANVGRVRLARDVCGKCGARRVDRQLGLEKSPDAYVAALVGAFREVRRVLRDDGTLWLNVGDSYSSGGRSEQVAPSGRIGHPGMRNGNPRRPPVVDGLKPKDLLGIPWRLAFALQADGWYLRSEIIWHKKSPMPESVYDRPTKAHEQIFLLAKRERYYYDAKAIAESSLSYGRGVSKYPEGGWKGRDGDGTNDRRTAIAHDFVYQPTRNRRSVWTVGATPFSDAHFAVMPPKLVEPCVLAGTSEKGCCPACGAPWRRVLERTGQVVSGHPRGERAAYCEGRAVNGALLKRWNTIERGWQPVCRCDAGPPVPCTVFDPFSGVGTTVFVANYLGRRAIGMELNRDYVAMARRRITIGPDSVRSNANGRPAKGQTAIDWGPES